MKVLESYQIPKSPKYVFWTYMKKTNLVRIYFAFRFYSLMVQLKQNLFDKIRTTRKNYIILFQKLDGVGPAGLGKP